MLPVAVLATAAWLGVLTSISPCPLASNVVAMSYVAKRLTRTRQVVLSAALYTLGRSLSYVAVAAVLVTGLLSAPQVSEFLQRYSNRLLGPVLIVAGMFMLELIRLPTRDTGVSQSMQDRVDRTGVWGAGLLGVVLALSFCPLSAGLFFGSLIPLAAAHESRLILPLLYGIGTAVPVAVFAVLMALGVRSLGRILNRLTQFERWARRITGVLFIAVGLYYSLVYIFGLSLFF